MMQADISVIVPAYNDDTLLGKCIDSVLSQTKNKLELILVDDGSQDNSGRICDEYAARDPRVRVIHQSNAGVSAARNAGIEAACCEYIGFVDADDWIDPGMFERMLQEAARTGADVVMCDAVTAYSDGRTEADTISLLSGNAVLQKADFDPPRLLEMAGSAWRCIYRKTLLDAYKIRFPRGVKFSEDRIFNLYALGQANMIAYIKEPYYYRYVNMESTVHRFHEDHFEANKLAAKEIEKAIQAVWDDDADLQRAYLGQLITGAEMAICNYYYKTSPMNRKERMRALHRLCDDALLREAIHSYGPDRKSGWILNKRYLLLSLYARLANLKHRR